MGYESRVDGYVEPSRSLDELLEALQEYGFELREFGYLDHYNGSSGFFVSGKSQRLIGISVRDGSSTASCFTEFAEALQEISKQGLIEEAYLHREGQDHSDTECYKFDGRRWYETIYSEISAPVDRMEEAKAILRAATADIKAL